MVSLAAKLTPGEAEHILQTVYVLYDIQKLSTAFDYNSIIEVLEDLLGTSLRLTR